METGVAANGFFPNGFGGAAFELGIVALGVAPGTETGLFSKGFFPNGLGGPASELGTPAIGVVPVTGAGIFSNGFFPKGFVGPVLVADVGLDAEKRLGVAVTDADSDEVEAATEVEVPVLENKLCPGDLNKLEDEGAEVSGAFVANRFWDGAVNDPA